MSVFLQYFFFQLIIKYTRIATYFPRIKIDNEKLNSSLYVNLITQYQNFKTFLILIRIYSGQFTCFGEKIYGR